MSKTRVCIVGAGAAGMSCAFALSKHPDKFEITIFDKQSEAGGMATSIPIDPERYGATYINDGVQGCSPAFANTIKLFKLLGYECSEVGMQISFGIKSTFWSNVFPSPLIRTFQSDISKFGRALKTIKRLELIFAFIPIKRMLSLFRFNPEFGNRMVYPLAALFFGTGNQTPYVSSAILARVFLDPNMRLFEFNERSLLASIPTMFAFPRLGEVYCALQREVEANSGAVFRLGCEVRSVVRRKGMGGIVIEYVQGESGDLKSEMFDELVMATDADTALKVLGKSASWMELKVLGSVKYLHDVTITHNDPEYMNKHYETQFKDSLAAEPSQDEHGEDDREAIQTAKNEFRPLYYTKQYEEDKSKIEMSFDLTHYQPQFKGKASTASGKGLDHTPHEEKPMEQHVFQTIFLDRDTSESMWTWREIRENKRIKEKWWKQSHRWQHYAKVVPWMMFINGKNHTYFAGAWTVLNMHELAVTSGFAAAYRLGAKFPFSGDAECERLFKLYLGLSHGARMVGRSKLTES
ncbi:hypothetical protein CTheo_8144 [Ceratobasidium theobromae]|uniref:Uncharacterized protein n=1 Tax=Ceratobasidium theobromae TaxID=1582974 RepID=A0A5N5Q9K7_9AGAM|nr:hypothetical protein CTheo_8144 [Ceratobasidium theobromae]